MNKIFNDPNTKKSITILTVSGILISLFVIIIVNFAATKAFFKNLFRVLAPFIWGILFALIIIRLAIRIESSLPKKMQFKTRRFLGALLSTLMLVIFIMVSLIVIAPSMVDSVASISEVLKNFATNPGAWINNIKNTLHLSDEMVNTIYTYSNNIVQGVWTLAQTYIPNILSATMATVSSIINFVIGFIICLYLLIDRRKIAISFKKLGLAILDEKQYNKGKRIMYMALEKFTNFFSGKVLDSLIIGVICFVAMLFVNPQYATLIGIIIGITNIIPFFGPIIGAMPCALILLIVDPLDCLIFIIIVIVLQQIDGNIIGPRILGDSVGLSSLWIMFAILVGGAYFGFFGMLLGVPIFSVLYYVIKEYVDDKLEEKNKEADE